MSMLFYVGRCGQKLLAVASIVLCLVALSPAFAQDSAAPQLPDPLTPAAVDALVSRLSDAQVRDLLLTELGSRAKAEAAAGSAPESLAAGLSDKIAMISARLAAAVRDSPAQMKASLTIVRDYLAGLGRGGVGWLASALGLALLAGYLANRAVVGRDAAAPTLPALQRRGPVPVSAAVAALSAPLRHLSLGVLGAVVSLAVSVAVASSLLDPREARVALSVLVWLVFVPRIGLEMVRIQSARANAGVPKFVPAGVVIAAVLTGAGEVLSRISIEAGHAASTQGAGFWLGTAVFALLAVMVWSSRHSLQARVAEGHGKSLFARAYLPLALFAVLWTWLASTAALASGASQGMQTGSHVIGLALVLAFPMFDGLIKAVVLSALQRVGRNGASAEAAEEAAYSSGVRIGRVVFFGATVLVVAWLWDISFYGVATGGGGGAFARRIVGALFILISGYIIWEMIRLLVNRRLMVEGGFAGAPASPDELDEGQRSGAASRLATILPPLGFVAQIAVIVVTVLMALDAVGVNVTPLLAGAGVAGIALGFGAQKLVADVVSGIFFLIEDAFRANEYINAGGIEGTVERLSIRSLHLRQSDGALNCIPYSNINAITNMSRDWGTMKQVFTVPFDTDLEKVRKIFKRIGQDLMNNPEFAPAFILPFKYKGVGQVNDVGIVVRGKFMFRPELSQQFLIQREIYNRVQHDFAAAGITFARREIHVKVDGEVAHGQAAALGAASAAAVPEPLRNP
ncbi:MAG TPA: mechanosensitive ion channel family protein [Tabrizicola sp.]|nr:mechanosensitive ion channel family protein [Tabrizicola sp.]